VARDQRRLAAIVAADVFGYSRLMRRDESGTFARLRQNRIERLDPTLARYGGRLVKLTGDGALVEFVSAVDALAAAIEFQQAMAQANCDQPTDHALVFRIGLHVGDLIVDGDDLYGDGVNVAARLESEAPAGGILVSRDTHDAVCGRLKATFEDLGRRALKNIDTPMQVYAVRWRVEDWTTPPASRPPPARLESTVAREVPLALPDKPSIAVLPFQNMSGDPEQEYFADGIVEDITTALSRFKSLFVVARNSSFTYKGRAVDIRQVGRELGVRYVLEGSVRKMANRVRITGQLIQADTDAHIWADWYDGELAEIFELQDQVTLGVVGAITPALQQAEIDRVRRKPLESLDAYDCHLRGLASAHRWTREGVEALRLVDRAIRLDPDFAPPYGLAAWCHYWRQVNGWTTDHEQETAEIIRLAEATTDLGKDDAVALSYGALALGHVGGEAQAGLASADRALALNPNLAAAWYASGSLRLLHTDLDEAIEHLERAMRLSPLDPLTFFTLSYSAIAHFFAGHHDEARLLAERACRERPNFLTSLRISAASNAVAGRLTEAREFAARALQLDPDLRVSTLRKRIAPLAPDRFAKYAKALRKAGVPE
jgi:TolB-like protein/class 3 adenylate cyclase/tetratricopeptide (TPR) repeat protein